MAEDQQAVGRALAEAWQAVAELDPEHDLSLPFPGERVGVVGAGGTLGVARAYAALREDAGHGVTDAAAPDDLPRRPFDRVLLLSATGDDPSLVALTGWLRDEAILAIAVGMPTDSPVGELAGAHVPVPPAEGPGGAHGAWASTAYAMLRHAVTGETTDEIAVRAMDAALPSFDDVTRWILVGRRASLGLAEAAACALRAAGACALAGTDSELRTGALGPSRNDTCVWWFEKPDPATADAVARSDAASRTPSLDAAGELVLAHRLADLLPHR